MGLHGGVGVLHDFVFVRTEPEAQDSACCDQNVRSFDFVFTHMTLSQTTYC